MYQSDEIPIDRRPRLNMRMLIIAVGMFLFVAINLINHLLRDDKRLIDKDQNSVNPYLFRSALNGAFKKSATWPTVLELPGQTINLEYSLNEKLTGFVKKIIQAYRPEYTAVIVIDNNNGNIITALGYERSTNSFNNTLPFSSTHPTASIFKIVTAATLISNNQVSNDTFFSYRGRGTTLYRYQLDDRNDRWSRLITFEHAFASSNNVVFAKASRVISDEALYKMAYAFGFNQKPMEEIEVSRSIFPLPTDEYNMAESASGFNTTTTASPVHAAMLSSVIANDGILFSPTIIKQALDIKSGEDVKLQVKDPVRVFDIRTAQSLRQMMRETIMSGTAKGSFRHLRRNIKNHLSLGGKTGSITGGTPHGKRDWFTGYAIPQNSRNRGISICVMNINVSKWYVRSAYLAQAIIEYYYKAINPDLIQNEKFAYEATN